MRTLGNLLWHFPFFGFVSAFLHYLLGILLIATVIGAPIGLGIVQYAQFLLRPFSRAMVEKPQSDINPAWQTYSTVVWLIYLPFGIVLLILSACQIIGLMCSLAGIPTAIVLAKSLSTYLKPINKTCVPILVRDEMQKQKARDYIDKNFRR